MGREKLTRDDEPYSRPRGGAAVVAEEFEPDDAPRPLDLDPEQVSPFLRAQKRVPVRRGPLARKTANRLKIALLALALFGIVGLAASVAYGYTMHSWRFRIASGENIDISGIDNVPRRHVLDIMGGDIGRNIFRVPLADRKRQLEQIPWVESATVMRLLPDRIHVEIHERVPVAFVRVGSRIGLIDQNGVIMEIPSRKPRKYSFPVITGMSDSEPLSTRAVRMKTYASLERELDSEGGHYSKDLSEIDLSDPEDVKVIVPDPAGAVLVHLGSSDFLRRYKLYIAHAAEWRQQYQKLESVDLRYDRQIIVNPDSRVTAAARTATKPSAPARFGRKPSARRGAAHAGVQ
jgi:cell division protein FtsQ